MAATGFLLIPLFHARAQTVVPPSAGPCVVVGTTATCTGNVSAGVNASAPLTTLNVNSLTQNIAPAAGVDGIQFNVTTLVNQNVTVDVDTGAFAFSVQNAIGIETQIGTFANNLLGNISITSTGNITATGSDGIDADLFGTGNITIVSTGTIRGPTSQAIDASREGGSGNTTITSIGDIVSDGEGINAFNRNDGTIYIRSVGNIQADGVGIDARTETGNVTVLSTGNITTTSGREGIEADVINGSITVTTIGNITTPGAESIEADVSGNGDIVITSTGNITSLFDDPADPGDEGIDARVGGDGSISVTSIGDISTDSTGESAGIRARVLGDGNVTISSTGNITTTGDDGVEAQVQAGSTATVNLSGGTVSGGSGTSAGVNLSGGAGTTNTLNVMGDASVTAKSGIAVQGAAGNDTLNNYGTVTGSVNLGNGANRIANMSGGTVNGAITTGPGDDTFNNTGTYTGTANLGDGVNTIANMFGGTINGTINTGAGDDIFNNDGTFTGTANLGGGNNSVTNTSNDTFNGTLNTGAGDDTVTNSGTFTGTVDLGGGTNLFTNSFGGTLNSGATLMIGAGNTLTNAGALSPAGSGTIGTTALTGNLVQTATGAYVVDVDLTAGTTDLVTVTGTANLSGTVQPNLINLVRDTRSVTILSAAGGTTNSGLTLPTTSPALVTSLTYPNANDVVLTTSIDFAPDGLNLNRRAVGNSLNSAFDNGQGALEPVLNALLNDINTFTAYQDALDQLLPEVFLNTEIAALLSAEAFIENLFSCRLDGENKTALSEGACLWARPQGRYFERDSDGETIGFDEIAGGIAAGGQTEIAPNWFAGFALGYERAALDTDTGVDSDSNRFNAGASIKFQRAFGLFAAAVSGGIADHDTDRTLGFGGFSGTAHSSHTVSHVAGQVRMALLLEHQRWFAKPLVDLNLTHYSRSDFTETGTAASALSVGSGDGTVFSITPALEFGGDLTLSETVTLRPYGRVGVSYYSDTDHSLTARFANAPTGTAPFAITSDFDDVFADVTAGATAFLDNGATFSLAYEGLIASDAQQHGGSVKVSIPF